MSSIVSAGDVVAGKYIVEKVLGEGGMGLVVAASHRDLGHRVAIKFLQPEALENPEIVLRFAREARTLAKLRSEHVARVIDLGDVEGAQPFIVMEFLEGRDLGQLLEESGPLPIVDAVDYVLQAAHAIAEAHALGVVHRDLKPANLFLADLPDGRRTIKVLDFGIARHRVVGDTKLTQPGATMGSPSYMAPEQMRSAGDSDERTDVWGFGAVLFELLLGHVPFAGASVTEVVAKVLADPTPSLRPERPEIPASLENAVLQCLSKRPAERFGSIAELARSLAPHGSDSSKALIVGIEALTRRGGRQTSDADPKARPGPDAPTVLSAERGPSGRADAAADAIATRVDAGAMTERPEAVEAAAPPKREVTAVTSSRTGAATHGARSRGPWLLVGGAGLAAGALWLGTRGPAPAPPITSSPIVTVSGEAPSRGPSTVVTVQPSEAPSVSAAVAPSGSAATVDPSPSAAPPPSGALAVRTATAPPKATVAPAASSGPRSLDMGLK